HRGALRLPARRDHRALRIASTHLSTDRLIRPLRATGSSVGEDRPRRHIREGGGREGSARLTLRPATGWPAFCSTTAELFVRRVVMNAVLVRPATSWMSVLGGWIATIGAMALVAPAVAGVLVGVNVANNDVVPAIP